MSHRTSDQKVMLDRFTRSLGKVDSEAVPANISYRLIWNMLHGKEELRQTWLVEAGWDPAWVFHNWHQLPKELKLDLCKVSPDRMVTLLKREKDK